MKNKKILILGIITLTIIGLSCIPSTVFAEDGGVQYPIPGGDPDPITASLVLNLQDVNPF